jgi:serine/threonine protein kinase
VSMSCAIVRLLIRVEIVGSCSLWMVDCMCASVYVGASVGVPVCVWVCELCSVVCVRPIGRRSAPEVFRSDGESYAADVWSMGVMIWQILTRQPLPYAQQRLMDVVAGVRDGTLSLRPSLPRNAPWAVLAALAYQCLDPDPAQRPSCARAMAVLDEQCQAGRVIRGTQAHADKHSVQDSALYQSLLSPVQVVTTSGGSGRGDAGDVDGSISLDPADGLTARKISSTELYWPRPPTASESE